MYEVLEYRAGLCTHMNLYGAIYIMWGWVRDGASKYIEPMLTSCLYSSHSVNNIIVYILSLSFNV